MDLITDNPVFLEIMEAQFTFYYEMREAVLEAASGLINFDHDWKRPRSRPADDRVQYL